MPNLEPRIALHPVSADHWSSYTHDGKPTGKRYRLVEIVGGTIAPPEMDAAISALTADLWSSYGASLHITTLMRSCEDQRKAWEADPSNAVEPGFGMHESGYALDADMGAVNREQFTVAAAKVGLTPISNEPWHWQLLGPWARLYNRGSTGPEEAAMAMLFDLGLPDGRTYEGRPGFGTDLDAAVQVQIWRAYELGCGAVDGWRGADTKAALRAMGLPEDAGYRDLYALPSVV